MGLLGLCVYGAWTAVISASPSFRLARVTVPVRCIECEFAIDRPASGVPVFNWSRFESRPRRVVTRALDGIVLENEHLRVTLIPSMGRVRSFIHKLSGHEQLWVNPVAMPIRAQNDTGFWVTWGGVECVLPRGEHGTSHALTWRFVVEEDSAARKAVRTWCTEPLTGLEHTVEYAIYPDKPHLETTITIRNPKSEPVRFAHWTTALFAPGGGGQVTPRTEVVVPAERFVAADRPFNRWMEPLVGPCRTSALRFMENWKDIGDLMSTPLTKPFYAVYCHEKDEGVVRTLDLARTPGFDIWTWGYSPNAERQREFTAGSSNLGYMEVWTGTVRDFTDEARGVLAPGGVLSWKERLFAVRGLRHAPDLAAALQRGAR